MTPAVYGSSTGSKKNLRRSWVTPRSFRYGAWLSRRTRYSSTTSDPSGQGEGPQRRRVQARVGRLCRTGRDATQHLARVGPRKLESHMDLEVLKSVEICRTRERQGLRDNKTLSRVRHDTLGFTLAAAQGVGYRAEASPPPRLPHDPPPLGGTGRVRGLAAPAGTPGADLLPGRKDEGTPAQAEQADTAKTGDAPSTRRRPGARSPST